MTKPSSSSSTSRPRGGPRDPAGSAGPAPAPAPGVQRAHHQPAQAPSPQGDPAVRQADNYGGQNGRDQAPNRTGSTDAAGRKAASSGRRNDGKKGDADRDRGGRAK